MCVCVCFGGLLFVQVAGARARVFEHSAPRAHTHTYKHSEIFLHQKQKMAVEVLTLQPADYTQVEQNPLLKEQNPLLKDVSLYHKDHRDICYKSSSSEYFFKIKNFANVETLSSHTFSHSVKTLSFLEVVFLK